MVSGYRLVGRYCDRRKPRAALVPADLDSRISHGAIILMHPVFFPDIKGLTINVLPGLIKELKAERYRLVTLYELLPVPAYRQPEDGGSLPALSLQNQKHHNGSANPLERHRKPVHSPFSSNLRHQSLYRLSLFFVILCRRSRPGVPPRP